ncbi:glycosyltransferase family 2 protein [Streptomyces sp. NPDC056704]|uniref:glycosyltransferase family 2 protein n=1 Tax=Streptomyces sp. NPDC056704 TaxID=3345917 RepID=UPI00368C7C9D
MQRSALLARPGGGSHAKKSHAPQRVKALPGYDYEHYSRLAGRLTQPPADRTYRVQYRSLLAQEPHRVRVAIMLAMAPLLSLVLLSWVLQPVHWTSALNSGGWTRALRISMVVALALIEGTRLLSVFSGAFSTLVARDPIPVVPKTGTRVAFLTTYVPGKEPIDMVRATLEAAVRLRQRGLLHIWLLDEGDDPELRLLCERLGVHHFSRKGVERWNQRKGPHRARTKHGNYNAWLEAHGDKYEFLASVDTDHIPLPNYLERMLGYFRDPDVAFVASPQVYGNNDSWIARAAESQQYLFHAVTQRAGNRHGVPMLVGTNNVIRVDALKGVAGFHDSITEDLATSLDIHRSRNTVTGRRWRSVYTPDVLAVGEGPNNWTDFFTQQLRWSRGTYEAIVRQFPRALFSFSPGRLLHYTLMLAFYPMMALNWTLSALSCFAWVVLGAGSVDIDPVVWLMLYGNASALQIGLYIWNRRHNVSPHDPEGSGGVAGMVMSALAAPIYVKAVLDTVLRRRSRFVVTPKGDSASPDTFMTFKHHLPWITLFLATAVYGSVQGGTAGTAGATWSLLALLISASPLTQWLIARHQSAREQRIYGATSEAAPGPQGLAKTAATAQSTQSTPAHVGSERARDHT